MSATSPAIIAFGGNLAFDGLFGAALFEAAAGALESRGITIERISSVWTTPAWPDPSDPSYRNAVALTRIATNDPQKAMDLLLEVELLFGRRRASSNAPRTLDLDLIDFGGLIFSDKVLTLPHPRMQDRAFVLGPLSEIAPGWRHPMTGRTAADMYAALSPEG